MRRKLFLFTLIAIFALIVIDYSGIKLTDTYPDSLLEKEVVYEGKIISIEKISEEKISLKVKLISADKKIFEDKVYMLLTCYDEIKQPWKLIKGRIRFCCEAHLPAQARNPGCFDYRRHLLSENIKVIGYVETLNDFSESKGMLDNIQKKLMELKYLFSASLPEGTRGILMGMVFGDTSYLDEDVYEGFRKNGTAHVLAVSGLHVGILYKWLKKAIGRRQTIFSVIAIAMIMITYCFLSSFSASALRAAAMIILSTIGIYMDRRYDMLTAASLTALIFIAMNPYIIFNAGFQMSFIAVCSIAFFYKRMPYKIPDSVAIMISANIGLMLYQIYVFNWFSVSSFIANVPVVYLVSITVPLGLAHFALFCIAGEIPVIETITSALSGMIVKINEFLSFGSGGFDMISPPLWLVILLYFIMFFLASEQLEIMVHRKEQVKILFIIIVFIAFSMFIKTASYQPLKESELVFVDVGQGDCVHVKAGEKNILIDGGGKADYNIGKNTLKPYLLKNGVNYVDLSLATHRHTDHFKGLDELWQEGMADEPKTGLTAGEVFHVSENIKIETLWPLSLEDDKKQDENANCTVFMIYLNGYKILVTGDLDVAGEKKMIAHYEKSDKLKADILKIGHHGSKTSTSEDLLESVSPRFAVIQVGQNNYGHPDSKIIEKCCLKGIIVLRNDTHGAVGFSFEKNQIKCHEMIKES